MSPAGAAFPGSPSRAAGFTLLEVVCALAIVAGIVALALPRLPFGTSRARLQAYAIASAGLMKADRAAAQRRGVMVATQVDAAGGVIRSGASGRTVHLPRDVQLRTVLPRRCNGRPVAARISFLPNGLSCGGVVRLARGASAYEVRVNWLTGGVDIVPQHSS